MAPPVGAHPLVVFFVGTPVDGAPVLGIGAPLLELAGVAGSRLRPVPRSSSAAGLRAPVQVLVCGTHVDVLLGVVAEVAGTEEVGVAEVEVGDRNVRSDAGLLQGCHVLAGAVLGVAGDAAGSDVPPEGGAPKEVEHGSVLAYLRGSDQDIEDHTRFATVHDVVGLVAEFGLALAQAHRRSVGIGGARQAVGGPLARPRAEGTLLPAVAGDPVLALLSVVLFESLLPGRGQCSDGRRIGSRARRGEVLNLLWATGLLEELLQVVLRYGARAKAVYVRI